MNVLLEFRVPGPPVAKGRARHARIGAHVRTYTPAKTARYENVVKLAAGIAMGHHAPLDEPLRVEMFVGLSAPRSWSRKRQGEAWAGDIRATKKPDLSNLVKSVEDGCNGVVWADDSQIVEMSVEKGYSDQPGVRVRVLAAGGRKAP